MSNPIVRPLSKELQNVAKDELFETDDNIIGDLKLLKEWILQSPHLKVNMNDQILLAFLRCCKHRLEKTKQKIDLHYTGRTHSPDIFDGDMINEKTLALIKLGVFLPLSKTESLAGPRIILTRVGSINFDLYKVQDLTKVAFMISYILIMEDDNYAVSGCVSINDFSDVKLDKLISWFLKIPLRRHIKNGIDGSLYRNKQAHLINLPNGYHTVMNFAKPFLNEKFKSRVSFILFHFILFNDFIICKIYDDFSL